MSDDDDDTEDESPLVIAEQESEEDTESQKSHKSHNNVDVKLTNHVNNVNSVNHNSNSPPSNDKTRSEFTEMQRTKGKNNLNNSKKESLMWTHNTRLRHFLFKEIKKPGRSMYYFIY